MERRFREVLISLLVMLGLFVSPAVFAAELHGIVTDKDGGISQYAELRIIKFPAEYIGNRDRPYLQEIIQNLVGDQKGEPL